MNEAKELSGPKPRPRWRNMLSDELWHSEWNPYWHFWRLHGRLRRLWRWAPFIWNDHEGDWSAILTIWAFKLKQGREHIIEHDLIMDAQKVHDSMAKCEAALLRLALDDYDRDGYAAHRERFPWRGTISNPDGTFGFPEMSEAEKQSLRKHWEAAESARAADAEAFCAEFKEGYRSWWD